MAVTQGHGNPRWARDETILALELYFHCEGQVPSKSDDRVMELSKTLRNHPLHRDAAKQPTFRNPDGVAFKLMNLRAVHTGKGLKNVSAMDKVIWDEFGNNREELLSVAAEIRKAIENPEVELDQYHDEVEFSEGGLLTRRHKSRERNRNIRKKLLDSRQKKGQLSCDMCDLKPSISDQRFIDALFEAHHVIPLAQSQANKTRLKDMALLCANCHRLIHRAISLEKRWLSISEARDLLFKV